jgi:hypothetical protein
MLKKILIGIVVFVVGVFIIAMVATQGIADVARSQLKALRQGDIIKAYSFTSIDFRNATSLDAFQKFVDSYPSLKNNEDVTFSDRETNNDTGILKGTLKSTDGASTPIEIKLVKEGGDWKILNLKLNPAGAGINPETTTTTSETQTTAKKGTIFDIRLNDHADSRGVVDSTKNSFTPDTAEIFASAYIQGADKGNTVTATMVYLDANEKIGPVTNQISEDGDRISNFSFSKPTKGWPTGNYKVTITLLNGQTKDTTFSVR